MYSFTYLEAFCKVGSNLIWNYFLYLCHFHLCLFGYFSFDYDFLVPMSWLAPTWKVLDRGEGTISRSTSLWPLSAFAVSLSLASSPLLCFWCHLSDTIVYIKIKKITHPVLFDCFWFITIATFGCQIFGIFIRSNNKLECKF